MDKKKNYREIGFGEGDMDEKEATMLLEKYHQMRKQTPVYSGVLKYFPDAIRAVAQCSYQGNEQHSPGKKLHWDKSKSQDELDALIRHAMEAGSIDIDGVLHSTKAAWRALANLQKEIEQQNQEQ